MSHASYCKWPIGINAIKSDVFAAVAIVEAKTSYHHLEHNPGGCTPLNRPYRYVPPYLVGFLRRFGLKTGLIHFAHFGLESDMVFEEATGIYERVASISNEQERKRNMRIRNGF